MDKKNLKKKRRAQRNKFFSQCNNKENINTARPVKKNNPPPPANVEEPNPTPAEPEGETTLCMEDWYLYINDYHKRKRAEGVTVNTLITDITNNAYWKSLPECDRKAMASALSENRDLHNRITRLEDENVRLKALLDEAKSLVEVLTELLEEEGDESFDERSDDEAGN